MDNQSEQSLNQDQVDLINQNAKKLLEKKRNMNKKGVINLGDSIKLNKINKSEGWTMEQEQNRLNLEENDADEAGLNLNTQEMKNIKLDTNDYIKPEIN